VIVTGGGPDIVVGGAGGDTITTSGDADVGHLDADTVVGDNGKMTFLMRGNASPAQVGELREIKTLDAEAGPNFDDTITTGNGEDRVIGGQGSDTIDVADRGPHNAVDDAQSGDDVITVSVNFAAGVDEGFVSDVAGYVAADNWINFNNQHKHDHSYDYNNDYYYYGYGYGYGHGDDYDFYDNHNKRHHGNKYSDSIVTEDGVVLTVGQDLDSSKSKRVYVEEHDQINADTQNSSLYQGYIEAKDKETLGIDVSGLTGVFGSDPYDVYLYIDAEDRDAATAGGFRLVSLSGETYNVSDPAGSNFDGEFVAFDPQNPDQPANVIIFRNVTGDGFEVRIDGGSYYKNGKWYKYDKDTPTLSGMQIVGGADKDFIVPQGDFDSDRVIGDQGVIRVFEDTVFEMIGTAGAPGTSADTILSGNDGDVLIGGDGDDTLRGEEGDDFTMGDAARVLLFNGEVIGFGSFDKAELDNHQFDPFGVTGVQLLQVELGGNDVIEGGRGDDWAWGGIGDDTYVFAGFGLGYDKLVEAGYDDHHGHNHNKYHYGHDQNDPFYDDHLHPHVPDGLPNDTGDALDFSLFAESVDIDLNKENRQYINGKKNHGRLQLSLSLFLENAFEDVSGSEFDDEIDGNDRNNALLGNGGNDDIDAHSGANFVDGGAGDDDIDGGSGRFEYAYYPKNAELAVSILLGGDGDDHIDGSDQGDLIDGGSGSDRLHARGGEDLVFGYGGDDDIDGGSDDDVVVGGNGTDKIKKEKNGIVEYSDLYEPLRVQLVTDFISEFETIFDRADFQAPVITNATLRENLAAFIASVSAP